MSGFEVNRVIHGDNLEVMRGFPDDCIDLIYLDPPFNTGTDFKQYDDRFKSIADFISFMRPRVEQCARILKPEGSFYLHCDSRTNAYQRVMCDEIFGIRRFLNEIVWRRSRISNLHKHSLSFGKVTDHILLYAKRVNKEAIAKPLDPEYVEKAYPHQDGRGRYMSVALTCDGLKKIGGGSPVYEFRGHVRAWQYSEENMKKLEADDRIIMPKKEGGVPRRKCYAHEHKGVFPTNLWDDIPPIEAGAKERVGYPTQKPVELLERIVRASSNAGDLVLDPFMGSGTTLVVAKSLNRSYVGIDRNPEAVKLANERLEGANPVNDEGGLF